MKTLGYAPQARRDLASIGRFIARDNPVRARTFIAELTGKAEQAAERPLSFSSRDELSPGLRSIVHQRYLILFRELEDEVRILRFLHSAQNIGGLTID